MPSSWTSAVLMFSFIFILSAFSVDEYVKIEGKSDTISNAKADVTFGLVKYKITIILQKKKKMFALEVAKT